MATSMRAPVGIAKKLPPRAQSRQATLVCNALVLKPTGGGTTIELKTGTFGLGAADSSDIKISVETVSGNHAKLKVDERSVTVTDQGSTNGTFVDGVKVESQKDVEVGLGSVIAFGAGDSASFTLVEVADNVAALAAEAEASV